MSFLLYFSYNYTNFSQPLLISISYVITESNINTRLGLLLLKLFLPSSLFSPEYFLASSCASCRTRKVVDASFTEQCQGNSVVNVSVVQVRVYFYFILPP